MCSVLYNHLFDGKLLIGFVSDIFPDKVYFNFPNTFSTDDTHLNGERYAVGTVSEYVLLESKDSIILGRINRISTNIVNVNELASNAIRNDRNKAYGEIQLLGTLELDSLRVHSGVTAYPKIGDFIYSAPKKLIADIPVLLHGAVRVTKSINLGKLHRSDARVNIQVEDVFSRHCAIVGATGSGKSWTLAHLIEEIQNFPKSKAIVIDSTGEYESAFSEEKALRYVVSPQTGSDGVEIYFPSDSFSVSQYFTLFNPSEQTQAPILRSAIESLRALKALEDNRQDNDVQQLLQQYTSPELRGFVKAGRSYSNYRKVLVSECVRKELQSQYPDFDLSLLPDQISNECVSALINRSPNPNWQRDEKTFGYCQTLILRVEEIINSGRFPFRASSENAISFPDAVEKFMQCTDKNVMVIDITGVESTGEERMIVVDSIASLLMRKAREQFFAGQPLVLFVDEAHNFLRQSESDIFAFSEYHGLESIAREGRKFSLNLCLATQRPRDLSSSVLSQIGTVIAHRLVNDFDRNTIKGASGEVNQALLQYLPDLRQGEALIFGTGIPIPLDIEITVPERKPHSASANYQNFWI